MILLLALIKNFFLTSSVSGFGTFTHNETIPFETRPWIWQYGKYIDGTVVLRIFNRNPNKTQVAGEAWARPVLSLRIIHPNGTVSEIDKDLEIPEFNWHLTTSPSGNVLDPISIFALRKGYTLVRYFNASNPEDIATYEECGRIIDWNGNLYDEVDFGGAYIENGIWYPSATTIVTNVDPEKGFIRIAGMNSSYIEWQQYVIDDSFNLKRLYEGNITLPQNNESSTVFNTIATVDEGYSIIMGNSTNSTNSGNNNPLEIRSAVYALTKRYNDKQFGAPKMIYQLPLDNITISSIATGISSTGIGQVCILTITQNNVDYYVKLNFLSSGSITEIVPLNITVPELHKNAIQDEPSALNARGTLIILPNNTMLISQIENKNTWSFNTTDIPKFIDLDNELSDGNITIYQIDNSGNNIIRQLFKGANSFCSISDNGLNVTVNVLKSTFSNPNSQFYVKVDNNFARSKAYRESLMGIYDNIWKFNTSSSKETFADTVSGVLRLTKEGTEYYENLNSTEKDQFFTDLHLELSKIIPVNIKRLSSNGKTQVDTTVSPGRQILISLNIQSSKEERSVASIIDNLNDIITYKNMTSIGLSHTAKYLDGDFGFKPKQNLWDKYKWRLLCLLLVLVILVVLFLIAEKMESKGRNMDILLLGLIIFDFAMDVLFVRHNGKVIEVLYIPSVVFLTVPIGINAIWAFYIISDENKSKTFLDWFTQHEMVASVFTVLSGADIETLSILYSNLAGFKFFQAPISIKGKKRIFWASCLTIFIEDIPQLIIQILYQQRVVTYDIIPFLALVSSCHILLINIIFRLFQAINNCRSGTSEYDFDSFRQLQTPSTERNSTSDESLSHSIDVKER
ncbi:8152_t:CDS:10 [Diversispora eburnea]|uniref:8152_t:CDS:1 n=1 Tax=Diversispora eburnea TaxID=1213867 RepID=A0A9N9F323_9GLOM|nr:8152_t:CDS:10 [Diversispora eburnea]